MLTKIADLTDSCLEVFFRNLVDVNVLGVAQGVVEVVALDVFLVAAEDQVDPVRQVKRNIVALEG
jgi:hypothetical protein